MNSSLHKMPGHANSLWNHGHSRPFEETQRLEQAWIWLPVFETAFLSVVFIVTEMPLWGFLIIAFFSLMIILFLRSLKLNIRIDDDGFHVEMKQLNFWKKKLIPWDQIESMEVRKLVGFQERSGYGQKISKSKSFYNLNGNMVIDVRLRDGRQMVVGTRKRDEVEKSIRAHRA